jgi:hypothetical protein
LQGRVLGDLAEKREEGLGQLGRVFADEGLAGLPVARVKARYEIEVVLSDHLGPEGKEIEVNIKVDFFLEVRFIFLFDMID